MTDKQALILCVPLNIFLIFPLVLATFLLTIVLFELLCFLKAVIICVLMWGGFKGTTLQTIQKQGQSQFKFLIFFIKYLGAFNGYNIFFKI